MTNFGATEVYLELEDVVLRRRATEKWFFQNLLQQNYLGNINDQTISCVYQKKNEHGQKCFIPKKNDQDWRGKWRISGWTTIDHEKHNVISFPSIHFPLLLLTMMISEISHMTSRSLFGNGTFSDSPQIGEIQYESVYFRQAPKATKLTSWKCKNLKWLRICKQGSGSWKHGR